MNKRQEKEPVPPADEKFRLAMEEGQKRRLEYLATLDPGQREMLAFPGEIPA